MVLRHLPYFCRALSTQHMRQKIPWWRHCRRAINRDIRSRTITKSNNSNIGPHYRWIVADRNHLERSRLAVQNALKRGPRGAEQQTGTLPLFVLMDLGQEMPGNFGEAIAQMSSSDTRPHPNCRWWDAGYHGCLC